MNSLNVSDSEIFGMAEKSGLKFASPKRYHELFRDNYQFSDASPLFHGNKLISSSNSSAVISMSVSKATAAATNRSTRNVSASQPSTSIEKSTPLTYRMPASKVLKSRLAKSKASPPVVHRRLGLLATGSERDLIENDHTRDPEPRMAVMPSAPSTHPSYVKSRENDGSMIDEDDTVSQKPLFADKLDRKRFLTDAKGAGSKEPISSASPIAHVSTTRALAPRHNEDTASYRARRVSHQWEDAAYRAILEVRDDIKSSLVSLLAAEQESMQRISDVETASLSRVDAARQELAAQRTMLEEEQHELKTQQERFELQRVHAKSELDRQASELAAAASSLSQHHTAIVEERRRIAWQRLQLDLAMRDINAFMQRQQPYSPLYRQYHHHREDGYPPAKQVAPTEQVEGIPVTAVKRLQSQRPRSAPSVPPYRKLNTDAHARAEAEASSTKSGDALIRGEQLAGANADGISPDTSVMSVGSHFLSYKRKSASKGAWH